MKIKKAAMLLAACALSIFAVTAHADAAAVAKIGDTEYENITAAFDKIQDGDTLTLVDDAELERNINLGANGDVINITIDLNGHTLTYNNNGYEEVGIYIYKNCGLTVMDSANANGKLVGEGEFSPIFVNGGTFTLKSGTVISNESMGTLVASSENNDPNWTPSVVNIEGGMIVSNNPESITVVPLMYADFNMTGGTIKGGAAAMGIGALNKSYPNTISISGGRIEGEMFFGDGNYAEQNTIEITGGTFTGETFRPYITADVTENDDGSFTVGKKTEIDTVNAGAITAEDGTVATGFLTTIKNAGTVNTIKWTVTSDGKSADSEAFAVNMTLNGDASFGLVVDGLCDAKATASAVID